MHHIAVSNTWILIMIENNNKKKISAYPSDSKRIESKKEKHREER